MRQLARQTSPANAMINRAKSALHHIVASETESSHCYMISHNWGLNLASCDLLSHQSTNNGNAIVIWNRTIWNWARSNLRLRESRNTQYPSSLQRPKTHFVHCMKGNLPTVIPSVRYTCHGERLSRLPNNSHSDYSTMVSVIIPYGDPHHHHVRNLAVSMEWATYFIGNSGLK